jgi:hypothetical protein
VNQEQFRKAIDLLKRVIQRSNQQQREINELRAGGAGGATSSASGGAVDLSKMQTPGAPPVGKSAGPHGGATPGGAPNFKVYFDLALVSRPGTTEDFTFRNYHGLLFFEIAPTPDLSFSFDVTNFAGFTNNYFELDYNLNPRLQLRAGKIWIPFDDMSPHNIFGGRVNTTSLNPPGSGIAGGEFLPNIWAELGVGLKYQFIDTRPLTLEGHVYVTNGFGSTTPDPRGEAEAYPNFSGGLLSDNNTDKAVGARLAAKLFNRFGVGASFYTSQYTPKAINDAGNGKRINMVGIDSQIRIGPTEFRTGIVSMTAGLPLLATAPAEAPGSFKRAGFYGELGYSFGPQQRWKVLGRGGSLQLDDRVIDDPSEQTIVGATLLYKPSMIEFSISHDRDLKKLPTYNKPYTSTTILRMVIAL